MAPSMLRTMDSVLSMKPPVRCHSEAGGVQGREAALPCFNRCQSYGRCSSSAEGGFNRFRRTLAHGAALRMKSR